MVLGCGNQNILTDIMYTFNGVHHNCLMTALGLNLGLYGREAASKQPLAYEKFPSAMWLRSVSRLKTCLKPDTIKG
jgi:hypothetical protein